MEQSAASPPERSAVGATAEELVLSPMGVWTVQIQDEVRSQHYLSWTHTVMFRLNNGTDRIHRFIQMKFSVHD